VAQCCAAASELAVPSLRDVADVEAVEAIGDPLVRARARHVVSENHRVLTVAALLQTGRLSQVGDLLLASHQSLRDDFEVSTAALDAVVEAAMAAGALGARVTGAGFGGSALVLVADHRADDVSAAVMDAFARKGWDSPTIMPVTPSDGARNLMAAEDSADGSRDPDV
jgi:galactokinase